MTSEPASNRRKFLATSSSAVIASLAGCSSGGDGTGDGNTDGTTSTDGTEGRSDQSGDIKIGVLLPFSGDYAWVGSNVLPVVRMIAEDVNGRGGIDGKKIQIVQGDTEGSPSASLSAAKRLINVEGVSGIIGPTSITMSAVFDLFKQNQVPVVTPTGGTTSLDDRGGKYVFRTVPSDALGGRALALAARKKQYNTVKSYSQMALMVGNKEVFQSFEAPITKSFKDFGGTITTTIDFKTGKASYQSEVQKMMDSNPGITALAGSKDDSIKIMQSAYQAGYEGNWFATQDQSTSAFLKDASNKITDGMFGIESAPYQAAQKAGRIEQFRQRFKNYTGSEPKLFSRNAYDAMNVMSLALKATAVAGNDLTGSNIAASIPKVAKPPKKTVTNYTAGAKALENSASLDYQGLVGPNNFDEDGDIAAPFNILQASGGKWQTVATIPPSDLK